MKLTLHFNQTSFGEIYFHINHKSMLYLSIGDQYKNTHSVTVSQLAFLQYILQPINFRDSDSMYRFFCFFVFLDILDHTGSKNRLQRSVFDRL